MADEANWVGQLIETVQQIGPIGVAALALIFGIMVIYMVLAVLRR